MNHAIALGLCFLVGLCSLTHARINRTDDRSYNVGPVVSEEDINATLYALCKANYLGYASSAPGDWISVDNFRIKFDNAVIDLSTLNDQNICDLYLDIDARSIIKWGNGVENLLGTWENEAVFEDVVLKVEVRIVEEQMNDGYSLVLIPRGWDPGTVSIISNNFRRILGAIDWIYNEFAGDIAHPYEDHFLNKPIKVASLGKIYEKLPDELTDMARPELSLGNEEVFVGLQIIREHPDISAVLNLLLLD